MMSMHIIDTDAFMDMPLSAQALYMHLLIRADDDGFIDNVKKIMRMSGNQDDDLKILFGKNFLIPFESGVCVIKHWRIHNYIQKDRYNATKYTDEMALLSVKKNGGYTLDTECIQNGDTGKVRLGKVSKEQGKKYGELENVSLSDDQYQKLCGKYGTPATDRLIEELSTYIPNKPGPKYKDHYSTLLNWAKRKKLDVVKVAPSSVSDDLSQEQIEANKVRIAKMRAGLSFKMTE
jgi:hypothetical protein